MMLISNTPVTCADKNVPSSNDETECYPITGYLTAYYTNSSPDDDTSNKEQVEMKIHDIIQRGMKNNNALTTSNSITGAHFIGVRGDIKEEQKLSKSGATGIADEASSPRGGGLGVAVVAIAAVAVLALAAVAIVMKQRSRKRATTDESISTKGSKELNNTNANAYHEEEDGNTQTYKVADLPTTYDDEEPHSDYYTQGGQSGNDEESQSSDQWVTTISSVRSDEVTEMASNTRSSQPTVELAQMTTISEGEDGGAQQEDDEPMVPEDENGEQDQEPCGELVQPTVVPEAVSEAEASADDGEDNSMCAIVGEEDSVFPDDASNVF